MQIYIAFGMNAEATKLLETVIEFNDTNKEREDIGEQLFFSYVREGKLLR